MRRRRKDYSADWIVRAIGDARFKDERHVAQRALASFSLAFALCAATAAPAQEQKAAAPSAEVLARTFENVCHVNFPDQAAVERSATQAPLLLVDTRNSALVRMMAGAEIWKGPTAALFFWLSPHAVRFCQLSAELPIAEAIRVEQLVATKRSTPQTQPTPKQERGEVRWVDENGRGPVRTTLQLKTGTPESRLVVLTATDPL